MPAPHDATARQLADEVGHLRTAHPAGNALLNIADQAENVTDALRRLVTIEAQAHAVELTAYGTMLARFPHRPAADLHLTLGRIVYDAGPKLMRVARSLGLDDRHLVRWPIERGAQAFNSAMSWVAMSGNQAAGALAAHADMTTYYPGCCALVRRLRVSGARVPEEFFAYYDDPVDDELCSLALEVVQDGLDRGDDPDEAVFHARRIEESIGEVWRTAAVSTG